MQKYINVYVKDYIQILNNIYIYYIFSLKKNLKWETSGMIIVLKTYLSAKHSIFFINLV